MDRLNKLNTAKEKISELEEELKENSCTKTWRVRNMENTEGKGGRGYGQKAPCAFIQSHRRRGESMNKHLKI